MRLESPLPTKPDAKPPKVSFRTKYILTSLIILALTSTIISLNQDNGTSTKYIGEVSDVRYSAFPTPNTEITYGLKPAPFAAPSLLGPVRELELKDGVYVRTAIYEGDLRGVFQVGGLYFVTQEKRPFALYPELLKWQASEIRRMSMFVRSSGSNGEYTSLNEEPYDLVFRGNYLGVFEYMHYYNITWFGDVLLNYNKIS